MKLEIGMHSKRKSFTILPHRMYDIEEQKQQWHRRRGRR